MNNYLFEETKDGLGLRLTGTVEEPIHAVVPAYVDGKPVTVIGKYAFSAKPGLKSVTLPETINRIEAYAFYNSTNIEELTLKGCVRYVEGGAFKRCQNLHHIKLNGQKYLNQLMSDLYNEVTFDITLEDGTEFTILLPEYFYSYEEFVQPRLYNEVDFNSGSYYRTALWAEKINFPEYDKAFVHSVILDEKETTITLAMNRLHTPYRLPPRARERYVDYVKEHLGDVAKLILKRKNYGMLETLLNLEVYTKDSLQDLITYATNEDLPQAVSILMDYKLKAFPSEKKKRGKFRL